MSRQPSDEAPKTTNVISISDPTTIVRRALANAVNGGPDIDDDTIKALEQSAGNRERFPLYPVGPITRPAQLGWQLVALSAVWGGNLLSHHDGLMQAVGMLVSEIGMLLSVYDPQNRLRYSETPEDCERRLRELLETAERLGFQIAYGSVSGIPDPSDPAWCALRVRGRLANVEFLHSPACEGLRAEPAIAEDPETIALAVERAWLEETTYPCPATGPALRAAIRDLQTRLDSRWASVDRFEKARLVVIACMRRAGIRKPSAFFDAERKERDRRVEGAKSASGKRSAATRPSKRRRKSRGHLPPGSDS